LINRAFIVRERAFEEIFDPDTEKRKTIEMRLTHCAIKGWVGVIKKGTRMIWGVVNIVGCICLSPSSMAHSILIQKGAKMNSQEILDYGKGKTTMHAWIIDQAQLLKKPIPYKHRSGAIRWVKINPPAFPL